MMPTRAKDFLVEGCGVIERVLEGEAVEALRIACEPLLARAEGSRPGVRRVLQRAPEVERLIRGSKVPELAREFSGGDARIVRSILFDKTPETNWAVPWHQDATIAVRERREVEGFGPWSIKDGEPHCRPPRGILDRILVVRVHLDAVGAENGPLRVVPRSHVDGLLRGEEVDRVAGDAEYLECCTAAGGVALMRPHSVHSSPRASKPLRRRVLHLEWSPDALPGGLEWAEEVRV